MKLELSMSDYRMSGSDIMDDIRRNVYRHPISAVNRLFVILVANKTSCLEIEISIMFDKYCMSEIMNPTPWIVFF